MIDMVRSILFRIWYRAGDALGGLVIVLVVNASQGSYVPSATDVLLGFMISWALTRPRLHQSKAEAFLRSGMSEVVTLYLAEVRRVVDTGEKYTDAHYFRGEGHVPRELSKLLYLVEIMDLPLRTLLDSPESATYDAAARELLKRHLQDPDRDPRYRQFYNSL